MQSVQELQSDLIRSLQNPEAFSHPAGDIRHLETHISHIILAGDYAYKIKKPVDLGFLDFSTLEKRRHFCEEELRLNGRLAPHIYLRVASIGGTPERPMFDGPGPAVEYAVQMRRFSQSALLTRFPLSPAQADRIARKVAGFHAGIPSVDQSSSLGTPDTVRKVVFENFRQIRLRVRDEARLARLEPVERWTQRQFQRLRPVLEQRRRDGFVRECHGDMHLGNMALVDDEIVIFDGIEFSPTLRWIDVMSEVAFLVMDLDYTGQGDLGWRFLNAYLELTGDYGGLAVLRFYQVYRALVRAKVEVIRLGQSGLSDREHQEILDEFLVHVRLAEGYIHRPPVGVLITKGVSGTGKTTFTQPLLERFPAIRIRSDVERKRLFGLPREAHTDAAGPARGIYRPEATDATYARLLSLARTITEAGDSVIVDATFLKQRQRVMFLDFALEKGLSLLMLVFEAPEAVLRERVERRHARGVDASEADVTGLEAQLAGEEPLTEEEKKFSMRLNFSEHPPIKPVLERWQQLLQQ